MKNMKLKKAFAGILACLMIFCMIPITEVKAEGEKVTVRFFGNGGIIEGTGVGEELIEGIEAGSKFVLPDNHFVRDGCESGSWFVPSGPSAGFHFPGETITIPNDVSVFTINAVWPGAPVGNLIRVKAVFIDDDNANGLRSDTKVIVNTRDAASKAYTLPADGSEVELDIAESEYENGDYRISPDNGNVGNIVVECPNGYELKNTDYTEGLITFTFILVYNVEVYYTPDNDSVGGGLFNCQYSDNDGIIMDKSFQLKSGLSGTYSYYPYTEDGFGDISEILRVSLDNDAYESTIKKDTSNLPKIIITITTKIKNYTFTFHPNSNGGEGTMDDIVLHEGDTYTLPKFTDPKFKFTKKGYHPVGWYTVDGSYNKVPLGETYTVPSIRSDIELPLYVEWEKDDYTCTIHFDGNGAEGSMEDVVLRAGDTYTLPNFTDPEFKFTKEGYHPVSWYGFDEDGEKQTLAPGTSDTLPEIQTNIEVTFYVEWEKDVVYTYTIHFDGNGAEGSMEDVVLHSGDKYPMPEFTDPAFTFKKTHWHPVDWYMVGEDGNVVSIPAGETIDIGTLTENDEETYYVNWESDPFYRFSFDSNGGEGSIDDVILYSGDKYTMPDFTDPDFPITKEGYHPVYWYFVDENGNEVEVLTGYDLAVGQLDHNFSATFHIKWEKDHEHNFELKHDETSHWYECECGEIKDKEAHQFGKWVHTGSHTHECTVCKYTETEECTFGEWKVTKQPTATEKGTKERTCAKCGYVEKAEIPATGTSKPDSGNTSKPDSNDPKTGDLSQTALWIVLMLCAAGASAMMIRRRREVR